MFSISIKRKTKSHLSMQYLYLNYIKKEGVKLTIQSSIAKAIRVINELKGAGDDSFLAYFKVMSSVFLAFATITILIITAINMGKLAQTKQRPGQRKEAIDAIGLNFMSLAIIGGADLIFMLIVYSFL